MSPWVISNNNIKRHGYSDSSIQFTSWNTKLPPNLHESCFCKRLAEPSHNAEVKGLEFGTLKIDCKHSTRALSRPWNDKLMDHFWNSSGFSQKQNVPKKGTWIMSSMLLPPCSMSNQPWFLSSQRYLCLWHGPEHWMQAASDGFQLPCFCWTNLKGN